MSKNQQDVKIEQPHQISSVGIASGIAITALESDEEFPEEEPLKMIGLWDNNLSLDKNLETRYYDQRVA